MSTITPKKAQERFIRFCIQYSSLAILYYDYSLTWPREVQFIWLRKPTLSTFLYWACRYAMVANVIYTFAYAEKLPTMSCDGGYQLCSALSVIGRVGIVVTWGARTWAVCNRNRWVLAFFAVLGLFVTALSIMHVPYVACNGSKGKPPADGLLSIMTVVYEILVFLFTMTRTIQALRLGGPWRNQRAGLTYLIFEQGITYFFIVTSFSIASLVLNQVIPSSSFMRRLFNALTLPLSGMLTARFLLHLREWEANGANRWDVGSVPNTNFSNIQFAVTNHPQGGNGVRTGSSFGFGLVDDFGADPVEKARIRLAEYQDETGGSKELSEVAQGKLKDEAA